MTTLTASHDVATETVEVCPVCSSSAFRPSFGCPDEVHDWAAGRSPMQRGRRRFAYSVCHGCGASVLTTRPTEASLPALYRDDYGPYVTASSGRQRLFQMPHTWWHRLMSDPGLHRSMVDMYTPGPGATLLDFGCGSPSALDAARACGFETVGADFTAGVIDRVRAAGHDAHLVDDLAAAIAPGALSHIRMNHVLEHLYAPVSKVRGLRDLLRPGGRIHIAVPNRDGLSVRLLRSSARALEPVHAVLYGPAQVRLLLESAGFSDVVVRQEVSAEDLGRSLALAVERLTGRPRSSVARFTNNPKVLAAALPLAKAAAAAGAADRIHAFARA